MDEHLPAITPGEFSHFWKAANEIRLRHGGMFPPAEMNNIYLIISPGIPSVLFNTKCMLHDAIKDELRFTLKLIVGISRPMQSLS
jgi:hypothetical protein